jgi:cell wall-associated NlpC family hydrolase
VPGDLVFFRDRSGDIYHVGMYASDGRFLHAPFTGDVVKYDSFSTPYYGQRFATGRRVAD